MCLATLFVSGIYAETNILTLLGPTTIDENEISVTVSEKDSRFSCLLSDTEHNTRGVAYTELVSIDSDHHFLRIQ